MRDSALKAVSLDWKSSLRWASLAVLVLLLLIPLAMVEAVVHERSTTHRKVLREIAGLWSGEQLLTGPLFAVPFTEKLEVEEEHFTHQGERKVYLVEKSRDHVAILLPRELEVSGQMEPSFRRRGIYEAKVYENEVELRGFFDDPEARIEELASANLEGELAEIQWSRASLIVGLTEPKGIVRIDARGHTDPQLRFVPGTMYADVVEKGFHAPLSTVPVGDRLEFALDLAIRGSQGFRWTPIGERSHAQISSSWAHPSFYGDLVPGNYEVSESGFTSTWELSHLIRTYPQAFFADQSVDLAEVTTGVALFEPVALYSRVTRAVKYGLLFIALTFLSLGLIELVTGVRIQFVHYLLIGIALAMFFMILIAFAEHLGFLAAYAIATGTVVTLNTAYCWTVLPRRSLAAMVAAVLVSLYGVLYSILRAEDYALLSGTLLLVAALAVTMFFTRRLGAPIVEEG